MRVQQLHACASRVVWPGGSLVTTEGATGQRPAHWLRGVHAHIHYRKQQYFKGPRTLELRA